MKLALSRPENQTAEILNLLLHSEHGRTRRQIIEQTDQVNPTPRITTLRKNGMEIPCNLVQTKNKFGNYTKYGRWRLTESDKARGIEIYEKINGKK